MADTQRDARIDDQTSAEQDADSRNQPGSGFPVSQMVANPRRVRRA